MEVTTPKKINKNYTINKAERDKIFTAQMTHKTDDEQNPNSIYPYIPVAVCDNLILQNVNLCNAIDILAEDMIYNNVIIKTKQNENNTRDDKSIISRLFGKITKRTYAIKPRIIFHMASGQVKSATRTGNIV